MRDQSFRGSGEYRNFLNNRGLGRPYNEFHILVGLHGASKQPTDPNDAATEEEEAIASRDLRGLAAVRLTSLSPGLTGIGANADRDEIWDLPAFIALEKRQFDATRIVADDDNSQIEHWVPVAYFRGTLFSPDYQAMGYQKNGVISDPDDFMIFDGIVQPGKWHRLSVTLPGTADNEPAMLLEERKSHSYPDGNHSVCFRQ